MNSSNNVTGRKSIGFIRTVMSMAILLVLAYGQVQAATYTELGAEIEQLTDRNTAGLIVETDADGQMSVDLQDRFNHAMLLQVGDDNIPLALCVSGIDEANVFFGRNLITGAALTPEASLEHNLLIETARRHGMNPAEYQFYGDLIENGFPLSEMAASGAPVVSRFSFSYSDGATEGFNSTAAKLLPAPGNDTGANLGEQRQTLIAAAALVWDSVLDTSVDITVTASFNPLSCTPPMNGQPGGATGGSAGSTGLQGLEVGSDPVTFYPLALANKLVGSDIDTGAFDIIARFNSAIDDNCLQNGTRFYYGLDNQTPAGTINLFMIMLHELGHGLGFATYTDEATGAFLGGIQDIWARFLYDQAQDETWDNMSNEQRIASAVNNNNVFWDGENVRAASGFLGSNGRDPATGRVQMYTPASIEQGSSLSHFNTNASPDLLMEPVLSAGLPTTLDLTRQQMRDIGWYRDGDTNNVPETITNVLPAGGHIQSGTQQTVFWDNSAGFDRNVTIELSVDGGNTFPHMLAENVSNTGSRLVSIPSVTTTQGRFRVREHDYVAPVGMSSANIAINSNSRPIFSPGEAVALEQGQGALGFSALGLVNDPQSPASSLQATQVAGGTATGINVADLGIAENGTVFAVLSASCDATSGTLRFEVSDGELTDSGDLQINVLPNPPPTLGTYTDTALAPGSGATFTPTSPPNDSGSVGSVVATILPDTYTGTLSVSEVTGTISVDAVAPEDMYVITVTVTDDCGAVVERELGLQVLGEQVFNDSFEGVDP